MASLPTAVAIHILQELACFATLQQVITSVKVNFGLVLTRQRIEAWHPESSAGARLGAHWKEIFQDTRQRFLAELADIGIANRSYRLKMLQRIADHAEAAGNLPLAMQVLEQAAREMGDESGQK